MQQLKTAVRRWWVRLVAVGGFLFTTLAAPIIVWAFTEGKSPAGMGWIASYGELLWAVLASFFEWLGSSVSMPRWLSLVLYSCLLFILAHLGLVLCWRWRTPGHIMPYDYRKDEFFGVVWRWEWREDKGMRNLTGFCRECDRRLLIRWREYEDIHIYTCSVHGRQFQPGMTQKDVRERVEIETETKVRNGQYVEVIRRQCEANASSSIDSGLIGSAGWPNVFASNQPGRATTISPTIDLEQSEVRATRVKRLVRDGRLRCPQLTVWPCTCLDCPCPSQDNIIYGFLWLVRVVGDAVWVMCAVLLPV